MSGPEAELVELFRSEAAERLDRFVDTLLAIERDEAPARAVDALFREAHTIKGSAGMVGLDDVRALAHAVEDVLAPVRDRGSLPLELVDPLLRAADELRLRVDGGQATSGLIDELELRRTQITNGSRPGQETEGPADERHAAPAPEPEIDRRSIRVPAKKIDHLLALAGETTLHRRRLEHELRPRGGEAAVGESLADELDAGERLLDELKDAAIGMRMLPLSSIVGPLPRAVRDLAAEHGKELDLVVTGAGTELDRLILESLSDPLVHVLRNAVAHGVEPPEERVAAGKPRRGRLELRAGQRGQLVEITVADDGRGVSPEALEHARREGSLIDVLARPGFSTADSVTDLSGRGVGLDAVLTHVQTFGGSLEARSEPGAGTEITLKLPLAVALMDVLLAERGDNVYGIPLGSVEEVVAIEGPLVLGGRQALDLRGRSVPLNDLADHLGAEAPALGDRAPAIIVASGGRMVAVGCDRLIGEEELLLKSLGPLLQGVRGYLGAAILGDARIALLLDPAALTRAPAAHVDRRPVERTNGAPLPAKVLVVEDSFTVRELQRSILEAAGYRVETARDGQEALERVSLDGGIDLVLTDVEMPEMDGLELTRAIRRHAERSSLPVVILTSQARDEDREAGVEAGADAFMVKRAFDQHALLETVERLVGR